jgi:hypothetical protein
MRRKAFTKAVPTPPAPATAPKPPTLAEQCERARAAYLAKEKLSEEWKKVSDEYDDSIRPLRGVPGIEAFGVRLVSSFTKKNVAWGHGSVREFEIELVDVPAAVPAKAAKKSAA